mmetsp:Transcript_1573/g.2912  ORF Transcript_1573/g.2912 Transcript_1573/m.2912 type:complete len:254 (-) Transcript_1573:258-1019(-)
MQRPRQHQQTRSQDHAAHRGFPLHPPPRHARNGGEQAHRRHLGQPAHRRLRLPRRGDGQGGARRGRRVGHSDAGGDSGGGGGGARQAGGDVVDPPSAGGGDAQDHPVRVRRAGGMPTHAVQGPGGQDEVHQVVAGGSPACVERWFSFFPFLVLYFGFLRRGSCSLGGVCVCGVLSVVLGLGRGLVGGPLLKEIYNCWRSSVTPCGERTRMQTIALHRAKYAGSVSIGTTHYQATLQSGGHHDQSLQQKQIARD